MKRPAIVGGDGGRGIRTHLKILLLVIVVAVLCADSTLVAMQTGRRDHVLAATR